MAAFCIILFLFRGCPSPVTLEQTKQIHEGMSEAEVLRVLGEPHARDKFSDGREDWYYWYDSFGIHYFAVGIDKNPMGKRIVVSIWI
jgi:outer membrane protein assembly factor BamE (lipoprotein component of BamABCDE complex)